MDDNKLALQMWEKALDFLDKRFPQDWGGCAVMYTEEGKFLVSVALESYNGSAGLCMETGAMCEAQKYNYRITHSLCVSRDHPDEEPKILTACGICRERLRYWGGDVKIAVTNPANRVMFKTLDELDPHYWGEAFPNDEREEYHREELDL